MRTPVITFVVFSICMILISGFWPNLSSVVLPNTTWGLYSKKFFEDLLVGAHGTIIDLFVVGIVLYWFEQRTQSREQAAKKESERSSAITRHKEALVDLRYYNGSDAPYRTLSTMKRLMALKVHDFSCPEANLAETNIEDFSFKNANMHAVNFSHAKLSKITMIDCACDAGIFTNSKLQHISLTNVSFNRAKFCGADLPGINFTSCSIQRADFTNANLKSAVFKGVDCKGVNFTNANLRSANFKGAQNLTQEMLQTAKSIEYIVIDALP